MKKLLTILCLVLLVSCSNEVPSDKLVERDGITYEVNSTTPFTGSSVSYWINGQLLLRKNYKNGKEDGLWESFHDNGQLEYRGNYRDGEPEGPWEFFNEDGNLIGTQMYRNGERVENG